MSGARTSAAVLIVAVAGVVALAVPALAIKPKPTKCNANTQTVKFESIDTFREQISASQDESGAVTVKASGANESDGYTRKDVCVPEPGQPWETVILSADDGVDTIDAHELSREVLAKLNGGGTGDSVDGHDGRDEIRGGADDDELSGRGGGDLMIGDDGGDEIDAGPGDDVVRAADGGRRPDKVDCGRGNDLVRADAVDKVKHCERVR